ncbi:MAG: TerC family protein [Deltaproteobacteria bacterium]|nr:TerC family protein [Deltaproteobacteria bacterium]
MVQLLSSPDAWLALLSLTALEIVLGIDNIVFIAILTERVRKEDRALAYRLGLGGALFTRVLLLLAISWVMGLQATLFEFWGSEFSGRDVILLLGGLFLIGKSAHEIFEKMEGLDDETQGTGGHGNLWSIVVQIMLLDIVFSLDSVITAVGMVDEIAIMVTAVIIAIAIMMVFAQRIGDFVNANPAIKILALSFLLLIGVLLTAEAFDRHIDKGYVYFAMGYALLVELVNMRLRKNKLRKRGDSPEAQG